MSEDYSAMDTAQWYVIVAAGGLACRFGPYTGAESGDVVRRAHDEGVQVAVVADCGRDFDWPLAKDLASLSRYSTAELEALQAEMEADEARDGHAQDALDTIERARLADDGGPHA